MGKLRHIAFISAEPKKLSDFYQKYFGFEECKVFPSGSRMVIDPLFNLAFLQRAAVEVAMAGTHRADGSENELTIGIHHYGFMVDDLDQAVAKLPAELTRGTTPQISAGVGGPKARGRQRCGSSIRGATTSISRRADFSAEKKRNFPACACSPCKCPIWPRPVNFTNSSSISRSPAGRDDGTIRLSDGTVTLLIRPSHKCGRKAESSILAFK